MVMVVAIVRLRIHRASKRERGEQKTGSCPRRNKKREGSRQGRQTDRQAGWLVGRLVRSLCIRHPPSASLRYTAAAAAVLRERKRSPTRSASRSHEQKREKVKKKKEKKKRKQRIYTIRNNFLAVIPLRRSRNAEPRWRGEREVRWSTTTMYQANRDGSIMVGTTDRPTDRATTDGMNVRFPSRLQWPAGRSCRSQGWR
ncbi:hypothetical protein BKA81DRAFT_361406 [Phyllosticta paracitricarpa]